MDIFWPGSSVASSVCGCACVNLKGWYLVHNVSWDRLHAQTDLELNRRFWKMCMWKYPHSPIIRKMKEVSARIVEPFRFLGSTVFSTLTKTWEHPPESAAAHVACAGRRLMNATNTVWSLVTAWPPHTSASDRGWCVPNANYNVHQICTPPSSENIQAGEEVHWPSHPRQPPVSKCYFWKVH